MTVKNVINGYMRQYEIGAIHIIELNNDRVIYGGKTENYMKVDACMREFKKKVDNMNVVKSICHNMYAIYLFVEGNT